MGTAHTELPEDDVPDELLAVVNQTEDAEILDEENDDYVPEYESQSTSDHRGV